MRISDWSSDVCSSDLGLFSPAVKNILDTSHGCLCGTDRSEGKANRYAAFRRISARFRGRRRAAAPLHLPCRPLPSTLMPRRGALHIGTSGWHYKSWIGPFYPEGTKASALLRTYSATFAAGEGNNSFYRLLSPRGLEQGGAPPQTG